MYFTDNIYGELCIYTVILVLLYASVRYLATILTNVFRKEFDEVHKPVNVYVNNVFYPVSYWSERGCRDYQEDRHISLKGTGREDSSLYGVFDGESLLNLKLTNKLTNSNHKFQFRTRW